MKQLCAAFITLTTCLIMTSTSITKAHAYTQKQASIAVIVNDDVITYYDVNDRIQLIVASTGMPNTPDTRQKLLPQVINTLIDEALQQQEAKRLNITIPDEQVDKAFTDLAQSNKMTAAQFTQVLQKNNAPIDSLRDQIRSKLIWAQVFGQSLARRVRISDADVDAHLESLQNNIGSTEYLLSEIYLPVDRTSQEKSVKQLAYKVLSDLKAGKTSFANIARQISKAPGAETGGMLGWVQAEQIDEKLRPSLGKMSEKTLSNPLRSNTGYHIFYLSSIRKLSQENIPTADQIRNKLFMERAERVSKSRLISLRSSAYIDDRTEAK